MTAEVLVERLRRFLLALSAFICAGTIVELWLTEHFQEPPQFIPFILCALGLLALGVAYFRPQRSTLLALRIVMSTVGLGSLLGVYFHLSNNLLFEMEIRPNALPAEVIMDALRGANPLLAPGVLALAAVLALSATYYHPALERGESHL